MSAPGRRVLVVEDDRFLRRACEASLRQRGRTVLLATRESDVSEIHRPGVAGHFVKASLSLQEPGDPVVRRLDG